MAGADLRAETRGLPLHILDQLGALNTFRKSGKILNQRSQRKLAARLVALKHQWLQIGASGVDGGRKSGASGAEDHSVTHLHSRSLTFSSKLFDSSRGAKIHFAFGAAFFWAAE